MKNIFENKFSNNLYHSYVIEGSGSEITNELVSFLVDHNFIELNTPDLFIQKYESFNIDESREIKKWHSESRVTSGSRICILSMKFLNHEASNALLKMLEEPQINTHFFIIIPNIHTLPATILSRVHVVYLNEKNDVVDAKKFIEMNVKERILYVSEIIKNHKDDDNSGGLRDEAIKLLNNLELLVYDLLHKDIKNKELQFNLEQISKGRKYLSTPGASVKMILEHIALVI